jgi:hypothetical protein
MADSDKQGTEGGQPEGSVAESNQKGNSSQTVTLTAKELADMLDQRFEAFRRTTQSEKDKAVKQTNQRLDGLEGDIRSVLQKASQDGQSISDVLTSLDVEEERQARQSMLEVARMFKEGKFPGQGSGGSEQTSGVTVTEVVQELELPVDDLRVKEFMSRNFTDRAEAYREAAKLTKSLLRQPSDADKAGDLSQRQSDVPAMQKLQEEYNTRSANLRGQALINLKAEMRKKGLATLH